jgi:hypothetical protein
LGHILGHFSQAHLFTLPAANTRPVLTFGQLCRKKDISVAQSVRPNKAWPESLRNVKQNESEKIASFFFFSLSLVGEKSKHVGKKPLRVNGLVRQDK